MSKLTFFNDSLGLIKGDVIEYSGTKWLLFEMVHDKGLMFQLNTNSSNYLLKDLLEIVEDLKSKKATLCDESLGLEQDVIRNVETEVEAKINERKRKIAYMLLHFEEDLLWLANAAKRAEFIRKVAKKIKMCEQTVRRFIHDFLQNNLSLAAIPCRYYKCGAKGKERNLPPVRKKGQKSIPRTNEVKEQMLIILKRALIRGDKIVITRLYDKLLAQFYPEKCLVDGVLTEKIIKKEERPSKNQFRYYVDTHLPPAEKYEAEKGRKKAINNIRPLHSDTVADLDIISPGERYEMDETETDFYLVSRSDRNQVIGRAILYFIVDDATKAIVGFQVGFDNNAWCGAELALLNMAEDKVEVCARAGIAIKEEQWPMSGVLPRQLMVDNGSEYMSYDFEKYGIETGTEILYVTSQGGSMKGNVEQKFRQFNLANKGLLPGEIIKDAYGNPHLKNARLTIEEFLKIVLEFIIHYNNTPLTTYPWDTTVLESGIIPTPANVWMLKSKQFPSYRKINDMNSYKYSLLSKGKANITRAGIEFNKVIYTCNNLEWLEQRMRNVKFEGKEKLDIRFDKRNMDFIYFMVDGDIVMGMISPRKNSNGRYQGCSYAEVVTINKMLSEIEKECEELRLQNKFQYDRKINKIVSDAKKAHKGKNKTKNIRENRKNEKEQLYKEAQVIVEPTQPVIESTEIMTQGLGKSPTLEYIESIDFDALQTHEKMLLLQKVDLEVKQGFHK